MRDEYVEVVEQGSRPRVKVVLPCLPAVVSEDDLEFAKRLENWRRVVLGSANGGDARFTAGWARLYVQTRDEAALAWLKRRFGEVPTVSGQPTRASRDDLDGWLVEAAVRSLSDFNERRVLQFVYVWKYPHHWIKTKLMLRQGGVRLVLGRAQINLKNILRNVKTADIIAFNNLHAGVDPRPESKDVPHGDALTLKKEQALID